MKSTCNLREKGIELPNRKIFTEKITRNQHGIVYILRDFELVNNNVKLDKKNPDSQWQAQNKEARTALLHSSRWRYLPFSPTRATEQEQRNKHEGVSQTNRLKLLLAR